MTQQEYLQDLVCEKKIIDTFLDETSPNWAKFAPKVGYLLKNSFVKDGVDESYTVSTYSENGWRKMVNYADKPCRINTYGNSFTQCHQVSDGESWQEYLAAHLLEPIRNFGIGGFGVFQAYQRLLEYENNPKTSAQTVILNIFSDDHFRTIDKWRWIRIHEFRREIKQVSDTFFHATPWNYLRINDETGTFEEYESLAPTRESLYNLTDIEFIRSNFKDDFVFQTECLMQGCEYDPEPIKKAAKQLNMTFDLSNAKESAKSIHNAYALKSSEYIIARIKKMCQETGKKFIVVLSYAAPDLADILAGKRFDQSLVDFIQKENIPLVDMGMCHKDEFLKYNLTIVDYIKLYYIYGIGHYNPKGNHFCAFCVKDTLVKNLDPKPDPYREDLNQAAAALLASRLA